MGVLRSCNLVIIIVMPIIAPTADDNKMIKGSDCQPNQAPSAASNLKSPYPIPSFPVINLNM